MFLSPWHAVAVALCFSNVFAKLISYDFSRKQDVSSTTAKTDQETSSQDPFLGVQYFSGYFNIGRAGGEMFYWAFPNRRGSSTSDTPIVLWMTGGPGCSSELAALTENGPLTVLSNATVIPNPSSWTEVADVVYVDQPLGTGFSSVGDPRNYVTSEKIVAQDMREFLQQFLELYPTYKNRPFYVTGESYAGHYVPAIAHALFKEPLEGLNLAGIAIGNGWVDPALQYPAYADYAFEHNMVGETGYQLAKKGYETCVRLLQSKAWAIGLVQCNTITNGLLGKRNPYDIRMHCDSPPLCYDTNGLNTFLNREDVQEALGVHKRWTECNMMVYAFLEGDWATQLRTRVAELLDGGVKVLVYSGDQDYICNWIGGSIWVRAIEWKKQEEFNNMTSALWLLGNQPAGEYHQLDNLTFLRVFNAGHMVPMDQPTAALAMLQQFLAGQIATQEPLVPNFMEISAMIAEA